MSKDIKELLLTVGALLSFGILIYCFSAALRNAIYFDGVRILSIEFFKNNWKYGAIAIIASCILSVITDALG